MDSLSEEKRFRIYKIASKQEWTYPCFEAFPLVIGWIDKPFVSFYLPNNCYMDSFGS